MRDGLVLAGWVGNQLAADVQALDGIMHTLNQRIAAPCLGQIPFLPEGDFAAAVEHVRLPFERDNG